jgi:hypothetical protein
VGVYLLKIPLMACLPRETKRKGWRPRMKKGNVDAKCQGNPGKIENEKQKENASGIHRIYEEQ